MKNYSYTSLILGIVVVVIVGILLIAFVRRQVSIKPSPETSSISIEEQQQITPGKKYTVVAGDTLWDIAVKSYNNGYNWVEIAKANNLVSPNVIEAGAELQIPEIKTEAKPEVKTLTVTDSMVAGTQVGAVKIEGDSYTVVLDDDLWDIAVRAYGDGYKWVEVAKANNLVNPDVIHAGNVLKLPR